MIKNLTRGRIHKTSLFIQPEYRCNMGCKGCYAVKGGEILHELAEELTAIGEGMHNDTIKFEQVTVSLNDLDPVDAEYSVEIAHNISKDFGRENTHYACAINSIAMYKDLLDFDTCSALNISIDANKYNKLNEEECIKACDAINSIRVKHRNLHINVNLLALDDAVDSEDENVNDMFEEVLESTDSTHIIMNKPIDNLFNFEKINDFKNDFENYIIGILQIAKVLGNKFHMDACVTTVLSNLLDDTTYTCRAGTDHASLWPDGKFTGCAYRMPDTEFAIGDGATIKFDDYNKIQDVKVAEFNLCLYNKLSVLYGSFDEFCFELNLNKDEINILKSVVK